MSWIESEKAESNQIGEGEQHKNSDQNDGSLADRVTPCETCLLCFKNLHGNTDVVRGANCIYVEESEFTSGKDSM